MSASEPDRLDRINSDNDAIDRISAGDNDASQVLADLRDNARRYQ